MMRVTVVQAYYVGLFEETLNAALAALHDAGAEVAGVEFAHAMDGSGAEGESYAAMIRYHPVTDRDAMRPAYDAGRVQMGGGS